MKTILPVFFSLMLLCAACQSQSYRQNFKYKGELPTDTYRLFNFIDISIGETPVDSVAMRNRVYVSVNDSNQVLLNGHIVDTANIARELAYITKNPDRLTHLPNSVDEVVYFLDYAFSSKKPITSLSVVNRYVKAEANTLANKLFSKNLEHLNKDELADITKKAMPVFAIPFEETGDGVMLPPWSEEEPDTETLKQRNIFDVVVDDKNEILIRGNKVEVDQITDMVKDFIGNPENKDNLAEHPTKAIISLKNDRGTSYKVYLAVYNAIKAAYNDLWDIEANRIYNKSYKALTSKQKRTVRKNIPLVISEAEPTGF